MSVLERTVANAYPLEGDLIYSDAGRQYGAVVDRILSRLLPTGQVLITSAGEGEGKTLTAANLALAFHVRKLPVLLVELALARPRLTQVFGESPLPFGIEDVLQGKTDLRSIVSVRGDNNLHLAMVKRAQGSDNLLAPGPNLDRLLADARRDFQWSIFDGSSISGTAHLPALAAGIGASIVVARAGRTRVVQFEKAMAAMAAYKPMVLLNEDPSPVEKLSGPRL